MIIFNGNSFKLIKLIKSLFVRRYIYGFEIDYELADLYESYLAANKYLLQRFDRTFFEYIQDRLDEESSCLIYDQLIKIGEREAIPFASVRTMIIEHSQKTLESEHFTQIDQETLISLLSLDQLSVDEINLLVAVSKWIDCEVQRQGLPVNRENRRRVFEPIKGYILFTTLMPKKIASCKEIIELLTFEERGSLVLHQLDEENNLSMIKLQTARRADSGVYRVLVDDTRHMHTCVYREKRGLTVSRRVSIRKIFTTYSERARHLSLKVLDAKGVDSGLKIESLVQDGRLCFSFTPLFVMEPNSEYAFDFTGNGETTSEDHQSRQTRLNYKELVVFNLPEVMHCVKGFEFCL